MYNLVDFNSITWVLCSNVLFALVIAVFILYYVKYGLQLLGFTINSTDLFSDFFGYFSDSEEEVGSVDDTIFFVVFFMVLIVWFFFFVVFTMYFWNNQAWILAGLNFTLLMSVLVPFTTLYGYGASFPMFVRGAGRTNFFFIEALLDFLGIFSMFSRFCVQNIRLVIIFIAFTELFEFAYQNCDYTTFSWTSIFSLSTPTSSLFINNRWYDILSDYLVMVIYYFFYVGHLVYCFLVQTLCYILLSFFLFFFLYTQFVLDSQEKYFLFKREFNFKL